MAAPAFIAASSATSGQENLAELAITIPVEATAGDRALLVGCLGPGAPTTDPDGWTHLFTSDTSSSGYRMVAWTCEVGSNPAVDPGATVTVDLSGNSRITLVCAVYGPSTVADNEVGSPYIQPGGGPYTLATPQVTAADVARAVHLYGINGQDSTNDQLSWEPDPVTTERVDITTEAPNFRNATVMLADETVTPGLTQARTATASHRAQACSAVILLSQDVDMPTATASTPTPQVAAGTTEVQLTGQASGGAGEPYTYQWRQISGIPVTLSDTSTQNPTFGAPAASTELVFGLTVTDTDDVTSLEDTVTVVVLGASGTAVPILDLTTDGWTAEPASAATISETLADNTDATYAVIIDPTVGEPLEVGLSELTPPLAGEPVSIGYRPSMRNATEGKITVSLLEGASTVIATFVHEWDVTDVVQQVTHQLTPEQVAAISDWSQLRLRFEGTTS